MPYSKKISFSLYRFIDLTVFTSLVIIFEIISVKALSWFSEIYYVTLFFTLSLIALMRWNGWAIIPILASGATYCFIQDAKLLNYVVYLIGNSFMLFNMVWFIKGKDKFKNNYIIICYIITGYLFVELGRSIVGIFYGSPFINTFIGFLGVESLSGLLALLIILIAKRQDGLFEDQKTYLKRINDEEKASSEV